MQHLKLFMKLTGVLWKNYYSLFKDFEAREGSTVVASRGERLSESEPSLLHANLTLPCTPESNDFGRRWDCAVKATVVVGNTDLAQGTVITTIQCGLGRYTCGLAVPARYWCSTAPKWHQCWSSRCVPVREPRQRLRRAPTVEGKSETKSGETAGLFCLCSLCFEMRFYCEERMQCYPRSKRYGLRGLALSDQSSGSARFANCVNQAMIGTGRLVHLYATFLEVYRLAAYPHTLLLKGE